MSRGIKWSDLAAEWLSLKQDEKIELMKRIAIGYPEGHRERVEIEKQIGGVK